MKNKKGFEMTISTVIVLVLALVLLGVGMYIIYTKILQPSNTATSVLTCESRGGTVTPDRTNCPDGIYLKLPSETSPSDKKNELVGCCIRSLS